jgi:uncharacterized protein
MIFMNFKNKQLCRIRTVTTFVVMDKDKSTWQESIYQAAKFCSDLSQKFLLQDYEVQSIRIVTNPFGEFLNTTTIDDAKSDLETITQLLNDLDLPGLRIRFAIGEARNKHEISLLPELIKAYGDLCNACVNVGLDENSILDNELITEAAMAVKKISKITPRGEGNFNFTVNFNCDPLIPYFPASYHRREMGKCFVIGLETPDLLVQVLDDFNDSYPDGKHNNLFKGYFQVMNEALQYHVDRIKIIVDSSETEDFNFSGFDSSAAPSKDCSSMVEVYKRLGVDYFGASGTVEASSLLTKVFKSIQNVELVGFSGLMLALTEDTGLAEGTIQNEFDIRSLLTYSAVCGIGLDTVPIPGDTSIEKISALMRDTGTMAFRLNKPLTVRLFPVPGLKAGDITAFESDDLCNCAVLSVP